MHIIEFTYGNLLLVISALNNKLDNLQYPIQMMQEYNI